MIKLQAALEYLTSYSWMIIAVVVVLAAFYYLGVFGNTGSSTVQPGACQIYRPNGPGTIVGSGQSGECQGAPPQYVAQFNGQSSNILIAPNASVANTPYMTVSVWVKSAALPAGAYIAASCSGSTTEWALYTASGVVTLYTNNAGTTHTTSTGASVTANVWSNIVVTYNGVDTVAYVNGVAGTVTTTSYGGISGGNAITVGQNCGAGPSFPSGTMSNLQVYNTGFSQSEVTQLYDGGIGAVPYDIANLAGWWPLNGNANDYSGNGATSTSNYIKYTTQWTSGYSAP